MKELLLERIDIDEKLFMLNLMQQYYSGITTYDMFMELSGKAEANKKKLIALVTDTGDLSMRRSLERKSHPFSWYVEHCLVPEKE